MRSSFSTTGPFVDAVIGDETVTLIDPEGNVVYYTRREWREFILGVKAGEFDVPE